MDKPESFDLLGMPTFDIAGEALDLNSGSLFDLTAPEKVMVEDVPDFLPERTGQIDIDDAAEIAAIEAELAEKEALREHHKKHAGFAYTAKVQADHMDVGFFLHVVFMLTRQADEFVAAMAEKGITVHDNIAIDGLDLAAYLGIKITPTDEVMKFYGARPDTRLINEVGLIDESIYGNV